MRRLMAVIALDVVGYSTLMAHDEDGTVAAWEDVRGQILGIFSGHGCRVVKAAGDGLLIEAPSVVEGTRAAIEVQEMLRSWNRDRPERAPELMVRIGVNLGDVVVAEDGDLYGDGVNVAARLEALAAPGQIVLSDTAYQQVHSRGLADFTSLGPRRLKNIPDPIRLWATAASRGVGTKIMSRHRLALAAGLAVAVILAVVGISVAGGGEAPQPTSTSSLAVTSTTARTLPTLAISWSADLSGDVVAMAVGGDTLYVATTDDSIQGHDLATGRELWTIPDLAAATMVADDRHLYVAHRGTGLLTRVEGSTGDFDQHVLALAAVAGTPHLALDGGTLYAAHGFGIEAIDTERMDTRWVDDTVGLSALAAIAVDGGVVVAADAGRTYRYDPPGPARQLTTSISDITWARLHPRLVGQDPAPLALFVGEDAEGFRQLWIVDTLSAEMVAGPIEVSGTPVLAAERVFARDADGVLVGLDALSGQSRWAQRSDLQPDLDPATDGTLLLVYESSDLVSVNPRSGVELGRLTLPGPPTHPPLITDSVVVLAMRDELVAVARGSIPAIETDGSAATTVVDVTDGRTTLAAFDSGGVGGSGNATSTLALESGVTYAVEDFTLAFDLTIQDDHWKAGRLTPDDVLFEWTGPDGGEAGTLYVAIHGAASRAPADAWAALEATTSESLARHGATLVWIDDGTGSVAGQVAEWRELRTPAEVTRPGGWPCAVSIPSGCIWKDSIARFYVVPVGELSVIVTVYENRCDCEAGPSYSKFLNDANELHDWTTEFERFLDGLAFDASG